MKLYGCIYHQGTYPPQVSVRLRGGTELTPCGFSRLRGYLDMQSLFVLLRKASSLLVACLILGPAITSAQNQPPFETDELSLIEAVRYTVANETSIKIEESQVEMARGALQSATGEFDITLGTKLKSEEDDTPFSEPDALSTGHAHQHTRTYSLSQNAKKTFRFGTEIDTSIGIERSKNKFPENSSTKNNRTFSFTVTQPLLQGYGVAATGANEASQRELYEAEQYTLQQTVAQKIHETVIAYWNYRGAKGKVNTYEKSIINIEETLDNLKQLIDGGEKPASDLNHYLANLAIKKIDLLSAQQELFAAHQTLAIVMGVPHAQHIDIQATLEEFPTVDTPPLPPTSEWLKDLAFSSRCDLKALDKDLAAAKYQMNASLDDMRPELDLALNFKYSNVEKGSNEEDNTSISAVLSYEFPVYNNSAAGDAAQAMASLNKTRYAIEGLKRSISSKVNNAVDTLATYSKILQQYEEILDLNKQRVKNERIQYTLGNSNLVIVIEVENNLLTSQIDLIDSKTKVANALINLRYVTGTILDSKQETHTITRSNLTTIPGKLL